MEHHVRFAPDDLMPSGRNWVMCRNQDVTTLYIRGSAQRWSLEEFELLLEAAWTAYRGLVECDGEGRIPEQRLEGYASVRGSWPPRLVAH